MSAQARMSSRPRVLFVDDEPRVLNSMRIMFRRSYELYLATNGRQALDILSAADIDVIVCDHRMPGMTGVEVLTRARAVSPRTVRILLTGYADLSAVEGSINEGEVFRFLTKPCAAEELQETLRLATELTAASEAAGAPVGRRDRIVAAREAGSERCSTPPEAPETGAASAGPSPTTAAGILVFSADRSIGELARVATRGRVPVLVADNIARVVEILVERRPGVLLTDISQDKITIQTMTAKLKQHLPQLVTIVISEHRDILDMVWLINHGQIFRFLRKPLSPGRCAISLKAALQHHQNLLENPEMVKRHAVRDTADSTTGLSVFSRLNFLRNLWSNV